MKWPAHNSFALMGYRPLGVKKCVKCVNNILGAMAMAYERVNGVTGGSHESQILNL